VIASYLIIVASHFKTCHLRITIDLVHLLNVLQIQITLNSSVHCEATEVAVCWIM